ncbi:MAG: adenylate kinase [Oscillospiraceae bacterium]|nr:adenylate kinase [Oscillospiraceae bacterium]
MKIIFLGAPGAGKGTQAEKVAAKLNIPTISTGAIIRSALKAGTEMGLAAKAYIEAGKLVPDDVVIGIIKERLAESDCQNGFILDGFPRTIAQAEALDTMGVSIDLVVNISVDDATIVERMSGRRVCAACGATFHTLFNPSAAGDKCDKCGAELSIRKDDQPEVVKDRLTVYHKETEPLERYYANKGILKTVIGQEKLEDTTALTFQAIGV